MIVINIQTINNAEFNLRALKTINFMSYERTVELHTFHNKTKLEGVFKTQP